MANEVVKETKNEIKDLGQKAITNMFNQVVSYASLENTQLSQKETQYAIGIITNINKRVVGDPELSWGKLDIQGNQLPAQIKRFARLNLQLENQEIFIDIRNNKNTGMKDINLKLQYQGLEKLMVRYCTYGGKQIVRFYKDVICKGDKVVEKPNLKTGLLELKDHEYCETDDVDYRNKLENIIGAYAIAYVMENGELNPYICKIDKNRILRARRSATTKNIWDDDTRKMTLKTAVWELWNTMRPFMVMPQDLVKDFEEVAKSEVDFNNQDFINVDVEEVNTNVEKNVATEEISATFEDENVVDNNGVVEETPQFKPFSDKLF